MTTKIRIENILGSYFIELTKDDNGGVAEIATDLKDNPEAQDAEIWNSMVDGIESLILAHFQAGIDVTSTMYREAITTALEAAENRI